MKSRNYWELLIVPILIISLVISQLFAAGDVYGSSDKSDINVKTIRKGITGYYILEFGDSFSADSVMELSVNNVSYEKSAKNISPSAKNKFYANVSNGRNQIDFSPLSENATISIKTQRGTSIIKTKKQSIWGEVEYDANISFTPDENRNINDDNHSSEPSKPDEATTEVISNLSLIDEADFSFFKAKISIVNAKDIISAVELNNQVQQKKDNKYVTFNDGYFIDESGYLFMNMPRDNSTIKLITKSGQAFSFKFLRNNPIGARFVPISEAETKLKVLKARLVGHFEGALINQKKYDGISGASSNITSNKNSNVELQVAETDDEDAHIPESAWKPLNKIYDFEIDKSKTKINIDSASGMKGVYSSYDSSITLSGTPSKIGVYPISVTLADRKGRMVETNTLNFKIYSNNEKLSDHLTIDNAVIFSDGKYKWDMEPWFIPIFNGNDEIVTVPQQIKAWYGSHISGTYGELGYYVEDNEPTQTLIVGSNTDLTLINMKIKSSVKIVVKNGGKLRLIDSSLYGKIVVENGGFLQANYDSFSNQFLTGTSINGQIILEEGSTLGSSLIYSNANALTDGNKAKKVTAPVVMVVGDANIDGSVFIKGDESPTGTNPLTGKEYTGQIALGIENSKLNLPSGSILGVYGGGKIATTTNGAPAMMLNNGKIEGDGKLIAVGGSGFQGDGGDSISGKGNISNKYAYLQGGNTYRKNKLVGKAFSNDIIVSPQTIGQALNGKVMFNVGDNDQPSYWHDILTPPNTDNIHFGSTAIIKPSADDKVSELKERLLSDKGVTAKGKMSDDSVLTVQLISAENTHSSIIDYIAAMGDMKQIDSSFDISISGKYNAPIELTLPVSDKNAKSASILHLTNGIVERYDINVERGFVKVTATSLSPFAVVIEKSQTVPIDQSIDKDTPDGDGSATNEDKQVESSKSDAKLTASNINKNSAKSDIANKSATNIVKTYDYSNIGCYFAFVILAFLVSGTLLLKSKKTRNQLYK